MNYASGKAHRNDRMMTFSSKLLAILIILSLIPAGLTSCGKAGGRKASDWKGTWYREGDSPFSRCNCEISNVSSEGFDFTLVVYNGNKAGELKDCHAKFEEKKEEYIPQGTDFDEDNAAFFKENIQISPIKNMHQNNHVHRKNSQQINTVISCCFRH